MNDRVRETNSEANTTESVSINSLKDLNWEMVGTGDFNNDHNSDILWRDRATGNNQIWLMNGTEVSQTVEITSLKDLNWEMVGRREIWELVSAGDFNGDNNSDTLWRNNATGENKIWLMKGTKVSEGLFITSISREDLTQAWWVQGFFLTIIILMIYFSAVFLGKQIRFR